MAWYKSLFSTQSWLIVGFVWAFHSRHCPTFATLEMRKELEPKCVPQWFLGLLLGTRQSAIGQLFFPVPRNNPESQLAPVYFSFLKWQIIRYFWVLAWSPTMCPRYAGSLRSLNFVSTILWKPSFCLFIYLFIFWYSAVTGLPFHLRSLTNKLLYLASVVSTLETWTVPWELDRL